jgi:hypothetical protein
MAPRAVGSSGHWKTSAFIAGLVASLIVDGTANSDVVLAYVKQVLVPTLPGRHRHVDNLDNHNEQAFARLKTFRRLIRGFPTRTAPTTSPTMDVFDSTGIHSRAVFDSRDG